MASVGRRSWGPTLVAALVYFHCGIVCADRAAPSVETHGTGADARVLFEEGLRHYDLAEFDLAIEEFKRAYVLSKRPELLFNLAQACRAKGDYVQAAHFYRTFLELRPQAPNRPAVEAALADVDAQLRKPAPPVAAATPTPPAPPQQPVVVASPRSAAPATDAPVRPPRFVGTRRGAAVIALSAFGGALLIASAASGGVAVSRRSAYDASCDTACNNGLFDRGRSVAIATDALIAVGAASAVTAVILALTRTRPHAREILAGRF